jgi:hypothetical protein
MGPLLKYAAHYIATFNLPSLVDTRRLSGIFLIDPGYYTTLQAKW